MRTTILAVCLATFASACSYSHIGPSITTFNRGTPPVGDGVNETQSGPLVLKISRHLDTVVRGPDPEEDQLLVLTIRNFRPGQKLKIPSENVTPEFTVTRFEPGSRGESFVGYLIVRKVTADKVDASLQLDVTARTASGSYAQTAKFHGNYSFVYRAPDKDAP
jgi:hypothetical protein